MKKQVSFIHCADVHLDAPFSALGKENLSGERRKDLKKTFERITGLVMEKDADFLVIAGDLYEHEYVARSTVIWLNGQFKRLDPKPVIIVPGNHDPCVKNSWYRNYRWSENVHILTTENPEYLDENLGVYFYGIGFDSFHQACLPVQKPPRVLPEMINICIFHGTLDLEFAQSPYNPADSDYLAGLGFDYYAVGHFHTRNEEHSKKGIINPGSPEPFGFDEQGEHGVYYVNLAQDGELKREYTFIKTQQRSYHEIDFSVDGAANYGELLEKIEKTLDLHDKERDIFRVNLTGCINPDLHIDIKSLAQHFEDSCFSIQFNDYTRPSYDLEVLAGEKNLAGVFVRKMKERMESAEGEEKQLLEKALYLGLEALFEGTVDISD